MSSSPLPNGEIEMHAATPRLSLVNSEEIEMWPWTHSDSPLWDIEFARDTYNIIHMNDKADNPREILRLDEIRDWVFDLCLAYWCLVKYTTYIPEPVSFKILDILENDLKFRASPLIKGPENLEDSAAETYHRLVKLYRPVQDRLPHLFRAMKWVAVLSDEETESCILHYLKQEEHCCEAVDHFGGTSNVVQMAYKHRPTYVVGKRFWKGPEWRESTCHSCALWPDIDCVLHAPMPT